MPNILKLTLFIDLVTFTHVYFKFLFVTSQEIFLLQTRQIDNIQTSTVNLTFQFQLLFINHLQIEVIKFIIILSTDRLMHNKFILPNGIATSGQELKQLQQKLLQNYYKSGFPTNFENKTNSLANTQRSSSISSSKLAPPSQKMLKDYDNQTLIAEQGIRKNLSNELSQQINHKNMRKMSQKNEILSQKQHLINKTTPLDSLQKQKQLQFMQKYHAEAAEHQQIKQLYKKQQFNQKNHEQQNYRKQYDSIEITRSQSMGKIPWQSYINPTKQYIYEIDSAIQQRNRINNISSNPQATPKSRCFKFHSQHALYPDSIKNSYLQQQASLQQMKQRQFRQRQDLKQVLLDQIKQKQEVRRQQRLYHRQIPYISSEYKQLHHPINNPIDFKYAHDNTNILKQLKSLQ